MRVNEVAKKAQWRLLAGGAGEKREVTGCYVGDLLSWVMARAQDGDIFVTVMGNVNAVAVAALTDAACILLTEEAALDEAAKQKAEERGIPVYTCTANSYEAAVEIHEILQGGCA